MGLGVRALGRCLGPESRAPMYEISDLIKEIPESSFGPFEDTRERQPFTNQEVGIHLTINLLVL